MNKRKGPVALFGLVVVALGAMAVINAKNRPVDPEAEHTEHNESVKEHNLTESERKAAASEAISGLKSKSEEQGGPSSKRMVPTGDGPGSTSDTAKQPTILLKKYISGPPKPADGTTATHWYEENSRSAQVSEANARAGR